ncbi:stage II sporulation protein M [Glycomyces harbinensis]|uniref:Stage II sporulation protein M n=1 Tax=Glycomyces harbinensis TaxID=58114 RepID=A0A1G7B1W4_9ACTN|nr:stage II sporulation protein M [Glycomyces harbinensis]SDE21013.1 Stage II sporulation protein M [Glycomyces harbinensis]
MLLASQVRLTGRTQYVALLVSLTVFITGALVGYHSLSGLELFTEGGDGGHDQSLAGIVGQNLGAAMLLYSGVVTLGISSLLGLGMTSAFVGATMAVAVDNAGWGEVIGTAWAYAPIEFGGCVVAAAAGLYPVLSVIGKVFAAEERLALLSTYARGLVDSLKLLALAVAMILFAGLVELVVIVLE